MLKQKKFYLPLVFLFILLLGFGGTSFFAEYKPGKAEPAFTTAKKNYHSEQVIVLADSEALAKQIAKENGLQLKRKFRTLSRTKNGWFGVFRKKKNNETAIEDIVDRLRATPGIRRASFDQVVTIAAIPNDSSFSQLWGMHNTGQSGGTADADIDAPEAWDLATGSTNVIVAIIDTGINYNHPDLSANIWTNSQEIAGNGIDDDGNGYIDDFYGIDPCNDDTDPMDDNSHGSHCAGTIGGKGNNGEGVAGVNWDVKLMGLKFLNSGGSGYTSDAVICMDYVIAMKQRGENIVVTSNSWGGGGYDQNMVDAINSAGNAGALFVCAAGNNSSDNDSVDYYPANYSTSSSFVIPVAATDHNDQLASFSNWGASKVYLGAPGVNIYSTVLGTSYGSKSGTSMATPHVAGAVGLLASVFPSDTPAQRMDRILNFVDQIPALNGKCTTGGRLNIYKAVQSAPFVIAKFSVDKDGELTRIFTDESTANYCTITGWSWDFGDGGSSTQQNPSHTYSAAGFYDVTLTVTADTGASDSDTQTIWAGPNQAPTADFTYSTPGGFQASFSDQSTDPDGTITGWNWDFGDGGSSTQQNPTHQYQYPGTYPVTLTATDDEGASDSVTKDVVIPLSYCASSGSSANPVAIVNVEIGPLSNSSGKSTYSDFMHLTANMSRGQTYDVTITIDSTFWDCHTRIYIDYNLDGDFDDANEIAYEVFIDNGTITGEITIPSAAVAGKKVGVRVSAKRGGYRPPCGDRDGWGEVEDYTAIFDGTGNQPPTANFTFTTDNLTANFTDTSTDSDGTIESWSWDFGDGGTSTAQNPSHTYGAAGTYSVTLTVTDDGGETDSVSKNVTVSEPGNQPPTADFTFTTNDLTANFTDTSTDSDGTITAWSWDFGDGGTSTAQNPSHTYAAAGTYTATLTVTDNDGATDDVSKSVTVTAPGNLPPTADFTFTTDNLTANFTDTSSDSDGTVTAWSWNFGDGNTSTQQNPSHTYGAAGTYTVTLTVTDNDGATDDVSKSVTVTDGGGIPTYCASGSISTNPGYITQVVVGSFSNSSGAAKYSDFTNMTVNMNQGQTYSISLTPYTSSVIWDGYWRIWIDYNRDGDFNDPGELAFENWMKDQNGQPLTGTITVPSSGVVTGQKLGMRVSFKISTYRDVCATNSGWGEVEDYAVIIQ